MTTDTNLRRLCIEPQAELRKGLELIDVLSSNVVFVTECDYTLLGIVTDGDVRRGILDGVSLSDPVSMVMNTDYAFADQGSSPTELQALMRSKKIRQVPILDLAGRLVDVQFRDEYRCGPERAETVFILAGGRGTRLGSLTRETPKPMIEINGVPMLEYLVAKCVDVGLSKIVISVNYLKETITKHFGSGERFGANIHYVDEPFALGTAGPLGYLHPADFESGVLVMNADIVTDFKFSEILDFHHSTCAAATVAVRGHETTIPFGVIRHENHKITSIEEKPTLQHFVAAGIYVFGRGIAESLKREEYLDMPDLLTDCIDAGKPVMAFPLHEYWVDVGLPENLREVIQRGS